MSRQPATAGRYRLLTRLAQGDLGDDYLARVSEARREDERWVVRIVPREVAAQFQSFELLLEQAKAAMAIQHDSLVNVIEAGECEAGYFIAFDYAIGLTVEEFALLMATAKERVPARVVAGIVRYAAIGLALAHEARAADNTPLGLPHGAVNPRNLVLTADGSVKVAGLGTAYAARCLLRAQQRDANFLARYLTPEQARGEPPSAGADQFSLGVVGWELLAGRPLFDAPTLREIGTQIKTKTVPRLVVVAYGTPTGLSVVIERMLERAPQQRFASCGAVAESLAMFLRESGGSAHEEIAALVRRLAGPRIETSPVLAEAKPGGPRAAAAVRPVTVRVAVAPISGGAPQKIAPTAASIEPEAPQPMPAEEPPPALEPEELQPVPAEEPPPALEPEALQPVPA
ncbi:MAG: protein kinase, partial [Deltaproteobacteria bacterium]|nr:protein kinase [Deltaproteobacteria bacterium]